MCSFHVEAHLLYCKVHIVHIVHIVFGSGVLKLLDDELSWREIEFTGIRLGLLGFVCGGCEEACELRLKKVPVSVW